MTMDILHSAPDLARPGTGFHPIQALAGAYAAWKVRRRKRADLALLMAMDPQMLNDIGVKIVHEPHEGGLFQYHPVVLTTTLPYGIGAR